MKPQKLKKRVSVFAASALLRVSRRLAFGRICILMEKKFFTMTSDVSSSWRRKLSFGIRLTRREGVAEDVDR